MAGLGLLGLCFYYLASCIALESTFGDGSDLTQFVTRPDIKAPLLDVNIFEAESIAPGYWFLTPYHKAIQDNVPSNYYETCQTGPHIYEGNGDLIWSGACLTKNQNAFDLKVFPCNDSQCLSMVLYSYQNDTQGHGVIMDNTYTMVQEIYAPPTSHLFDMHELYIHPDGGKASHFDIQPRYTDLATLSMGDTPVAAGWVWDTAIREIDLRTGETLFQWWALDHLDISESVVDADIEALKGPAPQAWDWLHANSIDQDDEGDHLISARHTDCIYKISRTDGSVLWRLGGKKSSFQLLNFNLSRQHDARWLERNGEIELISILNNDADFVSQSSTVSSALIVELNTRTMEARLVQRLTRPDHGLSRARGNMQTLPNKNVLVHWADDGYSSEFSHDGRLLMEARFRSERLFTYRGYKYDFSGFPQELPALKAFLFGVSPETCTTVYYASWNGATEVAAWRFYRVVDGTSDLIGITTRSGFETMFQSSGYEASVYSEAVDSNGSVLGTSEVYRVTQPDWHATTAASEADGLMTTASGGVVNKVKNPGLAIPFYVMASAMAIIVTATLCIWAGWRYRFMNIPRRYEWRRAPAS